ncbi:MAG: RNA 2',3'-cyclic phosphodiesterase [Clostridia bacterium]|nr:RNA 2',3'-cyclic phosphodiesterase [Clostridia bacterium]
MRLFIAVPLPKEIQTRVFNFERQLMERCEEGRFVPQGNFHITLHFFGETNELAPICNAMRETVKDARPFLLNLADYGYFAHGGARTSFLKVGGNLSELFRIHSILESALWERGFAKGRGRLQPHITLARAVKHGDLSGLEAPNDGFWVKSIVLFESRREKDRQVYLPVHTESF